MKEKIEDIEERLGYKNSELLRFHITEKITELNETVERNGDTTFGEISGDIFASLIDVFIVLLFGQNDQGVSLWNILVIIFCIVIFIPLQKGHIWVKKFWKERKKRKHNLLNNLNTEETRKVIREFDNIAFDYLLICHDYINKFTNEKDTNIKEFYFHEIVYYCQNSIDRFSPIYIRQDLYVCKSNGQGLKIELYRINNFINILRDIGVFLEKQKKSYEQDKEFYKYIKSIIDEIKLYELLV